jgi:hypothetical protein
LTNAIGREAAHARIDVVHHLLEPRPVVAGLVDLVRLCRGDDAAEAAGGLLAQVDGLVGVQAEGGDMVVRLAQAHRQVDQGQLGQARLELARQQVSGA